MSEAELKAAVRRMALLNGWLVYEQAQSKARRPVKGSPSGYPDLTLARYGRVLWIETKTDTNSLSDRQREWFRHLPYDAEHRPLFHVITPGALKDGTVQGLLA